MLRRCLRSSSTAAAAVAVTNYQRSLSYKPRISEFKFLAEDVLDLYGHYSKLGFGETANKDLVDSLLDESAKLSENVLFPLYLSGDDEGCHHLPDGKVTTPKGFKEAYEAMRDGGWLGISNPEEFGGQGLPCSVGYMTREMMATANWSLIMYPGLSAGAANTLLAWASPEQKEMYLKKIIAGTWSGTMCLTEPQCGTDLGQVKTRAELNADGTYRLTGTKIFISAGEHDMTENIVHIVLARLPDAPAGTKGISLFIVPRHVIKPDGTLEAKRNVICTGLEKKMGIKASATCQMTFEDSVGYIIGEPNQGMKQMFTFMNAARLGTALQGVAHAELAFQNALMYARERGSMRSLSGTKAPERVADPIIWHPNVRHNILFCKAIAEGGRAMILDVARMLDIFEHKSTSAEAKKTIDDEIGFLTPIAKACLTEWGLEAASNAVQVYGGHGFIKGNGVEQIVRDARISTLYEGTTGVQALDFIGRKVLASKTNEAAKFGARISTLTRPLLFSRSQLGGHARRLWLLNKQFSVLKTKIGVQALSDRDAVGAASQDFLFYTGYTVLGYYWLKMAVAAQKKIDAKQDPNGFYQAKLDTCNFYFNRVLPRADTNFAISGGASSVLQAPKEATWDL